MKYNRLLIFYFSGTGNAKSAANWIKNNALDNKMKCETIKIAGFTDFANLKLDDNCLLGFCYPTHGFNAPPVVLKFLRKLPKASHRNDYFILNTRAGMKMGKFFIPGLSGSAYALPALILKLKSYNSIGNLPLDLPSNWISLHPGIKPEVVVSMFERYRRVCDSFTNKIFKGEKSFNKVWQIPLDILVIPISLAYFFYGRFILSKTFIATNDCNNCGQCERECPVNAITNNGKYPFWTSKCESCMHCINNCPKRAIETPHLFTALVWWIAFGLLPIPIIYLVNNYINTNTGFDTICIKILSGLLSLLFIFLAYKTLNYLMKYKIVNSIVKATSFTHYKFWRRYKSPH